MAGAFFSASGLADSVLQLSGDHTSQPPRKPYDRVLIRRLQLIVEPWIQEEQCGFRPGRETVDQLLTLAGILDGPCGLAECL